LYLQAGTRVSLFFSFPGQIGKHRIFIYFHVFSQTSLRQGRVEEAFKDWSSKPIGSASIGQVQLYCLLCRLLFEPVLC
jgi:RNase P/RNase MRP subunit POP5